MDTQRKNKRKRPENTQNQEPAEQLAALLADKALQEMLQTDFTELLQADFTDLLQADFTALEQADFTEMLQADFTDLLKTEFEQLAKELAELDTLQ